MKIDVFTHILPQDYWKILERKLPRAVFEQQDTIQKMFPALFDLDIRFRTMDKFDGLVHVLTLSKPFIEKVTEPRLAAELAKVGNDTMAEIAQRYPDRFIAAIANLPMNNVEASLDEIDRTIKDLHFRGIQLCTDIDGKPLDSPEFMPIYEKMEKYDLPILLHPWRLPSFPDYLTESASKHQIFSIFGWPYDTTAAMTRLIFGQVLDKFPALKFITHHCGALVPFFAKRIEYFYERYAPLNKEGVAWNTLDYYRSFYADTALNGSTAGLMCGYDFFGADHMLFATDLPYDHHLGYRMTKETIESVEQMDIPESEKSAIFESNARKLLRLPT